MPRFVLIDQSITDVGGHHHEYATRVLNAARDAGYSPVLVTHRDFRGSAEPWPVHAVFRYGFWQLPYRRRRSFRHAARLRKWWTRVRVRAIYSPLGFLWQSRREGASLLPRIEASGLTRVQLALLALPAAVTLAVARAGQTIASLVPAKAYLGRVARALGRLALLPLWPLAFAVRRRQSILKALRTRKKRRAFGRDAARACRRVRLSPGDVVFIPTISELEMSGLARFLRSNAPSRDAAWHLLFRRNLYTGRDPSYPQQDESLRPTRNLFHDVARQLAGHRLHFYTDTDQLSAQWSRLGAGAFGTLPIPVDTAYHAPRRAPRAGEPLRVVYAGDAREEKGFHHLPRLARDMRDAGEPAATPVRFVAQSYYTSQPGEPGARLARAELDHIGPPLVTLIDRPLKGSEYRELVTSAGVALVLYDRDNYYARSSGIFTEAAAAGVPTLVPAGTWMAAQLEPAIHAAHGAILRRVPEVLCLDGEDVGWFIPGTRGANPMHDGSVMLAGPRARCVKVMVPPRAGYLHVSFTCRMDLARDFVAVEARQTPRGTSRPVESRHISTEHAGRHSRLVRLLPGAREVTIAFSAAYTETMGMLADVRLRFLSAASSLPLFGAGALYDRDDDMSGALRELVAHIDHYRSTAADFALLWRARHTPERLVRMLTAMPPTGEPAHGAAPLPQPVVVEPASPVGSKGGAA